MPSSTDALNGDCNVCGACCRRTPVPPFSAGEVAAKQVPAEWLESVRQWERSPERWEVKECVWFDRSTGLCRHYDYRPDACREFQVGQAACRSARYHLGLFANPSPESS